MGDLTTTGAIVLFLVALAGSRLVMNTALSRLTAEEKARLVDAFAGRRVYGVLVIAALVGPFGLMSHFASASPLLDGPADAGVLAVLVLGSAAFAYRHIVSLGLPATYARSFAVSKGIQLLGFAAILGVLLARTRGAP